MTPIQEAEALARRLFEGKTDKLGEPYIDHCLRVAGLLPADATETEKIAAILHDVLEDTEWSAAKLTRRFGQEVARIVIALTRLPGEFYPDFICWVIGAGRSAIRVKLADIADNLDHGRLERLPNDVRWRLASKYGPARKALNAALEMYDSPEAREAEIARPAETDAEVR